MAGELPSYSCLFVSQKYANHPQNQLVMVNSGITMLKVSGLTQKSINHTQMALYQAQRPISHARSVDQSQTHGS